MFWHGLGTPNRPRGHEEVSTQVDLFVVEMAKATISVETKFGAELSRNITTDLADLKKGQTWGIRYFTVVGSGHTQPRARSRAYD